jgi:hypothetical protein
MNLGETGLAANSVEFEPALLRNLVSARERSNTLSEYNGRLPPGRSVEAIGNILANKDHPEIGQNHIWPDIINKREAQSSCAKVLLPITATENVIRDFISNPNDAMTVLFEAAHSRDSLLPQTAQNSGFTDDHSRALPPDLNIAYHDESMDEATPASICLENNLTSIKSSEAMTVESLKAWNQLRYVRLGWITVNESIWLVDL